MESITKAEDFREKVRREFMFKVDELVRQIETQIKVSFENEVCIIPKYSGKPLEKVKQLYRENGWVIAYTSDQREGD
jgi:hypothetical protein